MKRGQLRWDAETWRETLRAIMFNRDIGGCELVLAVLAISWGIGLVNPLIDTFPNVHGYAALEHLAPEWFWGIVSIAIGFVKVVGVLGRHDAIRRYSAFVGWMFWFFISATFWWYDSASTAPFIYGPLAFFSIRPYFVLR